MGVHNTAYQRVTVYLKKAHVDFLDRIISELTIQENSGPSRSDLIRALLDKHCSTEDWRTNSLLNEIEKKSNGSSTQ